MYYGDETAQVPRMVLATEVSHKHSRSVGWSVEAAEGPDLQT